MEPIGFEGTQSELPHRYCEGGRYSKPEWLVQTSPQILWCQKTAETDIVSESEALGTAGTDIVSESG